MIFNHSPKSLLLSLGCLAIGGGLMLFSFSKGLNQETKSPTMQTYPKQTQAFHLATEKGWSNDLQTIVWNDQRQYYDIYFLHSADGATNPFGAQGQDWMHATTRDFITYSQQEEAIPAKGGDAKEGWQSAWTGSILINQGNIPGLKNQQAVAYFTGLNHAGQQTIYAVASRDSGQHFDQVLNSGKPITDRSFSENGQDFRDPYVFYASGKLLMYVAEGDVIGAYQSKDGLNWSKADPNGRSKILHETFFQGRSWEGNAPVECPVLKTMTTPDSQTKQVLFFGAKDASSGETTGTYYTVGHLDSNGLFVAETPTRRLDQGSDYYGANFTGSDDIALANNQLISLGWVGNWNYFTKGIHSDDQATSTFMDTIGFYSSPRSLKLLSTLQLEQAPIYTDKQRTLTGYYANVSTQEPTTSDQRGPWIDQSHSESAHGLVDLAKQDAYGDYHLHFSKLKAKKGKLYIDIWQGPDYVKIAYEPDTGYYQVASYAAELNQSIDGSQTASSYYYDGLLGQGQGYRNDSGVRSSDDLELTIITDNRSLEIFFPNGQTYTLARFNTSGQQDFKVFSSQEDVTLDMQVYDVHR